MAEFDQPMTPITVRSGGDRRQELLAETLACMETAEHYLLMLGIQGRRLLDRCAASDDHNGQRPPRGVLPRHARGFPSSCRLS